jgi:hypothetical protein
VSPLSGFDAEVQFGKDYMWSCLKLGWPEGLLTCRMWAAMVNINLLLDLTVRTKRFHESVLLYTTCWTCAHSGSPTLLGLDFCALAK